MPTLAEIFALFFQVLLIPLRLVAWMQDCARDDTGADLEAAYADVRDATARVEADDGRQPVEPLPALARRFLAGEMTADVSRLPRRQQAWLYAARSQGVDARELTDSDLLAHVRGRHVERGLDPLVDDGTMLRVRRAFEQSEAEHSWGTETLSPAY